MKYVAFVGTNGPQPREAVEAMNRDFPAYFEEMDRRGVRLFGRELEFPDKAVTVRVRGDETLVTDGPFIETKEYLAGLDLLECVDLSEAIEVVFGNSSLRFFCISAIPAR